MAREIEKKYLVIAETWREGRRGKRCRQGYLAYGPPVAVRVRIMEGVATLNIKTATTAISRSEFEYEIPVTDAEALLAESCVGHPIDKTRYEIEHLGMTWEVDEFHGANSGLVVAEVELDSEDQPVTLPPWAGPEVSGDPRYLNTGLSRRPYSTWGLEER